MDFGMLLAQEHFRHFVGIIVLVIQIFDNNVVESIHLYVISDDLAVKTGTRLVPIDADVRTGGKDGASKLGIPVAVQDETVVIVDRHIEQEAGQRSILRSA